MPTYEYHCEKCGKNFDAFQSMRDNTFSTCPQDKCQMEPWGEGTVKRQIGTGAGLIFKGSGFYITDYRSENYKKGAKNDSSAPPSASGGDSKSAAPASPKTDTPKSAPATPPPTPKPPAGS